VSGGHLRSAAVRPLPAEPAQRVSAALTQEPAAPEEQRRQAIRIARGQDCSYAFALTHGEPGHVEAGATRRYKQPALHEKRAALERLFGPLNAPRSVDGFDPIDLPAVAQRLAAYGCIL
jgi:hypothetical protein